MKSKSTASLVGFVRFLLVGVGLSFVWGCQADQLPRHRIPVPESPAALQRGSSAPPTVAPSPQASPTPNSSNTSSNTASSAAPSGATVAGLRWAIPVRWRLGLAGSMRFATYWIPDATNAAAQAGECSVFYFGQNQGGSLTANFDRWKQQFRPDPGKDQLTLSTIKQFRVRNLNVATLELQGTFLSSARPMDPQKTPKPDHEMFGVIVEAPQGLVFFKCVGARPLMQAAKHEFHTLVQSFRPR